MKKKSPSQKRKEVKRKALKAKHKEMGEDYTRKRTSKYAEKTKKRDAGKLSPTSPFEVLR